MAGKPRKPPKESMSAEEKLGMAPKILRMLRQAGATDQDIRDIWHTVISTLPTIKSEG